MKAFFLDAAAGGQRFCLFHRAQGQQVRGRIVYVHPFAEEMNKSRRMAALQARAFAAAGFSVLQIDLRGCGDSSDDFGQASWQDWVDDVISACHWLGQVDALHREAPLWLWGLRAGCLVAADAPAQLDEMCNFCFWQAAVSGKQALQQFLRLKLAADLQTAGSKGLMKQLQQDLAEGKSVEVAGYQLNPAIAEGLAAATLLPNSGGQLEWFELGADGGITVTGAQTLAQWTGSACRSHVVQGPAFWQTSEIEQAPELIAATTAALRAAAVSLPAAAMA